jgi:hypothetical protein
MTSVTSRFEVRFIVGSVATTRSPSRTRSMRLRLPSAMSTSVSGVKLFTLHAAPPASSAPEDAARDASSLGDLVQAAGRAVRGHEVNR